MSEEKKLDRRGERVDAADAKNKDEKILPGQVPAKDADEYSETGPEGEERQPDPVEAEQAVNPELQGAKGRKGR